MKHMKNGQLKDNENGGINRHEELDQPFIQPKRAVAHEDKTEGIPSKMDQLVWFCLVQALQFAALSNLEYA